MCLWMLGCSLPALPFSASCDAMLTMLVSATCWLYVHLYTLAYMSMHASCLLLCCPYFNTMKLWTSDPNLHLSLTDTTFCLLLACLPFICLFASSLVCLPCLSCLLTLCSFICICAFSFHCLSVGFLSFPLHVRTWSELTWS